MLRQWENDLKGDISDFTIIKNSGVIVCEKCKNNGRDNFVVNFINFLFKNNFIFLQIYPTSSDKVKEHFTSYSHISNESRNFFYFW